MYIRFFFNLRKICGGFFNFRQILFMKFITLLTLVLFLSPNTGNAQQPRQFKAQFCGTVTLRDVDDKYNVSVYSMEMPDVDGAADLAHLMAVKAEIAKKYPRKQSTMAGKISSTVPSPIIGQNFIADSNAGIPPDNYMAISDSMKAVSVINQTIAVHDATTGNYLYRKSLQFFSSVVGLNSLFNDYRYDPKVVYDPVADRFICVMLNGTDQYNYIVLAFSKTNDPAGAWNFYKFYGDYQADSTWFDYPAISITQNDFFLTGNKIIYNASWQAGFTKSLIYQVRKQDGYNGDSTLTYQIWDSIQYNGTYLRCLHPLNPGDYLQGPSQYFMSDKDFSVLNDTVFLVKVADTIGAPGNNVTVTPIVSSLSYGVPPDARQPDTAHTLATNDNRVLGGFIEGNEIQFVCTSVSPISGSSAVYHGVISNYATTPTLVGRMFTIDSLDFGYPNISYAGNSSGVNQSIITFNYSGPNTYPSFGGIFFDGANYSDMVTIKRGDSSISILTSTEQRWGDYSGSQPQWGAPGIVWTEGIYGLPTHQYGNYMAQLMSPYFTGVKEIAHSPSPSSLFPNPAWQFISFEFSITQAQAVDFVINDAQGKIVTQFPSQMCNEGKNKIQFNIATLAQGTYFLEGAGRQGEKIKTQTFVKE